MRLAPVIESAQLFVVNWLEKLKRLVPVI